jgi:hypothetical protein
MPRRPPAGDSRYSPRLPFMEWGNTQVPNNVAGVYAIWRGSELVYTGIAGRGLVPVNVTRPRSWGLLDRLMAHASGARSGDQFCIYVIDRLVLPELQPDQIRAAADGVLRLDELVRAYIRTHLSYSFLITDSHAQARSLEDVARRDGLGGSLSLLNPLRHRPR